MSTEKEANERTSTISLRLQLNCEQWQQQLREKRIFPSRSLFVSSISVEVSIDKFLFLLISWHLAFELLFLFDIDLFRTIFLFTINDRNENQQQTESTRIIQLDLVLRSTLLRVDEKIIRSLGIHRCFSQNQRPHRINQSWTKDEC